MRVGAADGEETKRGLREPVIIPVVVFFLLTCAKIDLNTCVCCYLIGTKGNIVCLDFLV